MLERDSILGGNPRTSQDGIGNEMNSFSTLIVSAFEIINSAQDRVDACGEVSTLGVAGTIAKSFFPRTHQDDIISEVAELRGDHTIIESRGKHRAVGAPEFRLGVDTKAR